MSSLDTAATEFAKARVRQALGERFQLNRKVERDGLRRLVIVCMMFIAFKFIRVKFFGRATERPF